MISNDVSSTLKLKNISDRHIFYTVYMLWEERIFKQLRFVKWLELRKLYKNKQIIAVSEAVKDDLLHNLGIKAKPIKVIYDAFDIKSIQKLAKEPIDLTYPYILNISALSKEKNHTLLLKTYAKLDTKLDLVIIGTGKLELQLKKLAKKLEIEKRVHCQYTF